MSRSMLSRSPEQLTAFDLTTCVAHADALNQRHRAVCTTPFPKGPRRWLSHDHLALHPLTWTTEGSIEGGLSWLVGVTIACSFTRAICAPHSGTRGGPCSDPARLVVLEVAATVDQ